MMNFNTMKSTAKLALGRSGLILKKFSPEILIGVGVLGIVTSTVMACKVTKKVDDVLDETNGFIDKIKYAHDNVEEERYSEKDYRKDLLITYTQSSVEIVKLYGPAITLGLVSVGCILGAHNIMRKRNVALVAAYKVVEQSFSDYRKRVVNKLGVDSDREFRYGITKEIVKVDELDADGNITTVEKTVEHIDPNGLSLYARFFNERSSQWSETHEYNLMTIKCRQNYANDLLNSRGHIFLNEVYDALGLKRSTEGAAVGWVKGNGDGFVDFGLYNAENSDFVNGFETGEILLDFNVDGVIWDLI